MFLLLHWALAIKDDPSLPGVSPVAKVAAIADRAVKAEFGSVIFDNRIGVVKEAARSINKILSASAACRVC
jgi:hypothetical protein